jgi:heme/copper-type cytochrome/quinol oxidase subunit 2
MAGLFDEAWQRERKRKSWSFVLLLLAAAAAAVVLIAKNGSVGVDGTRGALAADRYQVCASNTNGLWRYTYGQGCVESRYTQEPYSYRDLVLPEGSSIALTIAPSQNTHVLRITGLGVTLRSEPGTSVQTDFRTPRAGRVYSGECAGKCRPDPSFGSATVAVINPATYRHWLAVQSAEIVKQDKQSNQLRRELKYLGVIAPTARS